MLIGVLLVNLRLVGNLPSANHLGGFRDLGSGNKIRTHVTSYYEQRLAHRYIHALAFQIHSSIFSLFIENKIWARARWLHDDSRCGDRRARKSEKRCSVERGMEEKYKIRVRKNIKLPSCGSTGGAPPPLQLHRPRFIRQGLCGKGLRWESQTTVTDISDNHKHNDPHTRIQ